MSGSVHMFNSSRPRGRSGERAKRARGQKIDQGGVQGGGEEGPGKKDWKFPKQCLHYGVLTFDKTSVGIVEISFVETTLWLQPCAF